MKLLFDLFFLQLKRVFIWEFSNILKKKQNILSTKVEVVLTVSQIKPLASMDSSTLEQFCESGKSHWNIDEKLKNEKIEMKINLKKKHNTNKESSAKARSISGTQ